MLRGRSSTGAPRRQYPGVGAVWFLFLVAPTVALVDEDETSGLVEAPSRDVAGEDVQRQTGWSGLLGVVEQPSPNPEPLALRVDVDLLEPGALHGGEAQELSLVLDDPVPLLTEDDVFHPPPRRRLVVRALQPRHGHRPCPQVQAGQLLRVLGYAGADAGPASGQLRTVVAQRRRVQSLVVHRNAHVVKSRRGNRQRSARRGPVRCASRSATARPGPLVSPPEGIRRGHPSWRASAARARCPAIA